MGRNIAPDHISIIYAPLNFKCKYIYQNLSGFNATSITATARSACPNFNPTDVRAWVSSYSPRQTKNVIPKPCPILGWTLLLNGSLASNQQPKQG